MVAVIMAGGKGSRIASLSSDVPKPMIRLNDKPVLEYQIECLREQGINRIIITVAHKKEVIMEYFGNGEGISPVTGKSFGVEITYYEEEEPLGNAGALFKIRDFLVEDFLLLNGDIVFDVSLKRFIAFHGKCNAFATLFVHPNTHPYDSAVLINDSNNCVVKWLSKNDERPLYYKNIVNAGIHIINPKLLDIAKERLIEQYNQLPQKIDLDNDILKPATKRGCVYCYESSEYVKDMGTPERYERVCADINSGLVHKKNLKSKQKCIFLDRDGTINKYVGFVREQDDLELIPGVSDAIKRINESEYLAIVVTNQPVIARGEVTIKGLDEIHNKMETLLGEQGTYLDGIYYCPHHPDGGFEGEVKELKIKCECRKPQIGLFLKSAKDFNIDLSQSWMVGDSKTDILAGNKAGCRSILIGQKDFGQEYCADSLEDAINYILSGHEKKGYES